MKTEELVKLYNYVTKLKELKRAGWVRKNVPNPESVADHSFSTAILAMLIASKRGLNVERAMKIALIHDLGESIIGDITPHDGISKDEKQQKELEAITSIFEDLDEGEDLISLWKDFEEKVSPEAKLVAGLDKLDAYLQAREYSLDQGGLDEFLHNACENIEDPELLSLLDELEKQPLNRA